MRPVFHQSDENTRAHLNLAVIAYQMVNTIRYQLKSKGIHYSWSNIVRIKNIQKIVTASKLDKQARKILIRTCSKPEPNVKEIYDALGYKQYPFIKKSLPVRQTGMLPENEGEKIERANNQKINES